MLRLLLLIVLSIAALLASLIVVPWLAREAGLHEQHVNYATAAAAFLIVVVAVRRIKSLMNLRRRIDG